MKKVLSLSLALLMIVAVFCGCTQEYTVKVNKDDSCKITIMSAIPVETIEEMKALSESATEEYSDIEFDEDMEFDYDDIEMDDDFASEDFSGDMSMTASPTLTEDDFAEIEKLETEKVNGKECYVEEITKKFKSTKKASKFMLEGDEETGSYFDKFTLTKKGLSATIMDGMKESAILYGDDFSLKLKVTFPYLITKTDGKLSEDKKTVTFDLTDGGKIYAYTTKSPKAAKIYFKKDYLKSNSSAYISWNKVSGAQKYKVQYKASDAKKWTSVTTKKTAKTIKGLKAGTKYSFKVTAITKSKSYTSQKTTITTLKKVQVKVKSKTDKSIKLSWKKDKNADGYIVYQKASKNAKWKAIKTIKKNSTVTYNVKKLKSEEKYYFKVVSYSTENSKKVESTYKTLSAKTY